MQVSRYIAFLVVSMLALPHTAHSGSPSDEGSMGNVVPIHRSRGRRRPMRGGGIPGGSTSGKDTPGGGTPGGGSGQPMKNVTCDSPKAISAICRCWNNSTTITCGTKDDPCNSSKCLGSEMSCEDDSIEGFSCTCESCGSGEYESCEIEYFPKRHKDSCTEHENITTSTTGRPTTAPITTLAQPEVDTDPAMSRTSGRHTVETVASKTTTVVPETEHLLAEKLLNSSSDPATITLMDLEVIIQELEMLEGTGSTDQDVATSFIGVVNNVMDVSPQTLQQVPDVASLPQIIEDQLSNLHQNVENYTQVEENIAVSVLKVAASAFERPFKYSDPLDGADSGTKADPGTLISLPPSILDIIQQGYPNISSVPLTFITYKNTEIFLSLDAKEEKVITRAISAEVDIEGTDVRNLTDPVVIDFTYRMEKRNSTTDSGEETVCAFWDYSLDSMTGEWSTEGCRTILNDDRIICHCNHLTSFAVLVRGTADTQGVSKPFAQALGTITVVGCCISIGCLVACLLLMLSVKSVRVKQETRVHINLCISLLGLYLTFVVGIERTGNPVACRIIGAIIHFFCLASVAWMAVEAFVVYRLIYRYQRSDTKYLLPCSVIFAWGVPAVAAVLAYVFDNDFPEIPDFCFLHRGASFYFGLLLPAFLLTAYNSIVFTLATYRMNCRSVNAVDEQAKRKEVLQRVHSTVLFWVLLGISWLFGFLSAFQNPTSSTFQLLFCVFLTLQGLFLFYFIFAQNPIMKAKVSHILTDPSGSLRFFSRGSRNEVPHPPPRQPSEASSNVYKMDTSF